MKEEAGRPVVEALIRHVQDKRLLLILDNCEHLVQSCAEFSRQLLEAGQQMKVLATSREPLRIGGETTYPLPPLEVANPQQALSIDRLTRFEGVYLFVQRAVAAQPAFRLTPSNAVAVAAVCRALDGIPLAIELAAARLRTLSVEKVGDLLADRFRLLTGGDRTTLPRQQTLRACIDWSHDLLSERERALLRRLAVFAGGWTLEAAEAIAAGGDIATSDVLELLTWLAEKSLVEAEATGNRFKMLETVRQYAQERLDMSGEGDETRSRHVAFYLALVLEASPMLVGPEQPAWLARLDLERDNFLAAIAWCEREDGDGATGLKFVDPLQMYWFCRGSIALGHRLAVKALAHPANKPHTTDRSGALSVVGQLSLSMGCNEEARRHGEEALQIAVHLGQKKLLVEALWLLGGAWLEHGDMSLARGYAEKALALARESGSSRTISVSLSLLGEVDRAEGDLVAAGANYEASLALDRERGGRADIAVDLSNFAITLIGRNAVESAFPLLREALAIALDSGSEYSGHLALGAAAALGAVVGEWTFAARLNAAAEAYRSENGMQQSRVDEAFLAPLIATTRAALGEVAFAEAERFGHALGYEGSIAEARAWLESRS